MAASASVRKTIASAVRAISGLPTWIDGAFVAVLCVAVAMIVFGVAPADLRVPLLSSGDGGSAQYIMKTVLDHGWYTQNPDVGAPFGATMYDYPIPEPTHLVLIRLLGVFGEDPFLVFNLFYLFSFASVALAAWWALRRVGVERTLSIAGAFLFALLPYHFLRVPHVYLASYFAAPIFLAYALRLALYSAPHVPAELRLRISSIVLLAIAAGGGVYYAFFGCLFIAAGASLGATHARRMEPLRIGTVYVIVIVAVIAASLMPNALYHLREGANALIAHREPHEAEIYGLRITQLLLPSQFHRFDWMRAITTKYNLHAPLINENTLASLGVLGSLGLLAAMALALLGLQARFRRVVAIGAFALVGILFATIGGFGSLFAVLVTPELRGLNRMSVFLGFLGIAALLMLTPRRLRARPIALTLVAVGFMIVGAIDEIPTRGVVHASPAFHQEQIFFDYMQSVLPAGTSVFELPYMYFPEAPRAGSLMSYDLFAPYLHTTGLRWSFGDMHGRASDVWNEQVSTLRGDEFVGALANAGFGALYLDRLGYSDHGAALEQSLSPLLGPPVIEDAAKNVAVYRIAPERAERWPFVVVDAGRHWHPWVDDGNGGLVGAADRPSTDLIVANPGQTTPLDVEFKLTSTQPRRIGVIYDDQELVHYDLKTGVTQKVVVTLVAQPGVSRLRLDGEAQRDDGTKSPYRIEELTYGPAQ